MMTLRDSYTFMLGRIGLSLTPDWTARDLFPLLTSVLGAVLRGFMHKPFLKSSKGPILVKKRALLKNRRYISVGRQFIAEEGCEINGKSLRGVVFGDRATVGAYALIRPSNYYGGQVGEGLRVGNNSNIGAFGYVGCSGFICIGNNVMLGPRVSLYAENHVFERTDITIKEQGVSRSYVTIEDDCWIGSHSVILAGVTVGKGSVVAAGSVVTEDVPPYSIVAGVPARLIKSRLPADDKSTRVSVDNVTGITT